MLEGLSVGAGVRHIGASFGDDNANTINVPGNTPVDASAALQEEWLKVALNVSSPLDKTCCSTCYLNESCIHGEGRVIKGSRGMKF